MKMAYLTHQGMTGHIREKGLAPSRGRFGHGIYAVPLLPTPKPHKRRGGNRQPKAEISTTTLWQWLVKRHRQRNALVAVFEIPENAWPIRLYLDCRPEVGMGFLQQLSHTSGVQDCVGGNAYRRATAAWAEGRTHPLEARIPSSEALETVLRLYTQAGARPWAHFDEQIEVVIDAPVKADRIESLRPLESLTESPRRQRTAGRPPRQRPHRRSNSTQHAPRESPSTNDASVATIEPGCQAETEATPSE